MDVTVNINASAIVEAINRLSEVLTAAKASVLTANQTAAPSENPLEVIPSNTQVAQNADITPMQTDNSSVTNTPQATVQPPQIEPTVMTINQPPIQQTAPVVDEAYRNRVCNAAARLVEQNKMPDVLALLSSFGVQAVTQLTATQLPEFANGLVAMGAVI